MAVPHYATLGSGPRRRPPAPPSLGRRALGLARKALIVVGFAAVVVVGLAIETAALRAGLEHLARVERAAQACERTPGCQNAR